MKAKLVKEGHPSEICIRTSERVSIVQVIGSGGLGSGSDSERLPDFLESVFEAIAAIGYELTLSPIELTQVVLGAIAEHKSKAVR